MCDRFFLLVVDVCDFWQDAILSLCDKVRDEDLVEIGVRCEDRPNERSRWILVDDREGLKRERDEKKARAEADKRKKLENKIGILVRRGGGVLGFWGSEVGRVERVWKEE